MLYLDYSRHPGEPCIGVITYSTRGLLGNHPKTSKPEPQNLSRRQALDPILSPHYPRQKKGSFYINIRNPIHQKVQKGSLNPILFPEYPYIIPISPFKGSLTLIQYRTALMCDLDLMNSLPTMMLPLLLKQRLRVWGCNVKILCIPASENPPNARPKSCKQSSRVPMPIWYIPAPPTLPRKII